MQCQNCLSMYVSINAYSFSYFLKYFQFKAKSTFAVYCYYQWTLIILFNFLFSLFLYFYYCYVLSILRSTCDALLKICTFKNSSIKQETGKSDERRNKSAWIKNIDFDCIILGYRKIDWVKVCN